jgi:hypothetical protein
MNILASPIWLVDRERKGRGRIHLPLHPCMMTHEWNSLCWLVESEREEINSIAFFICGNNALIFMMSNCVPLDHDFSALPLLQVALYN